ncbi:M28 family peptidase [Actinoplanes sp. NPDC023714]|uniref:M28 family peptidase n=1 Tax=Actinoplanes sp. NPDC023714 TaxID=3154322 RepID=UPI0034018641
MRRSATPLLRALPAIAAAGAAIAALRGLRPPRPAGPRAPLDRFSAVRAEGHLRVIAAEPRPIGSPGAARARAELVDRLRGLGLETGVQEAVAVADLGAAPYGVRYRSAGRVHNIVARIPGTHPGRSVLVMTHYDSVEQGPGVSDAGMLAAAVLETARALLTGPPPRNDIVFLLTDGEEAGLLGARAFFDEHPAAARVGAVLNFEARGTRGPALMFETGPASGALLRHLADLPRPAQSSSLFDEAYRRMPNTTDFAVARERGLPGLNFANIGGFADYHGPHDDFEHRDRGTLQHHGEVMTGLARRLGAMDLDEPAGPDPVFFSAGPRRLVHYPAPAAGPLAVLAAGAAVAGLIAGRRGLGDGWRLPSSTLRLAARLVAGGGAATALTFGAAARSPQFRRSGDFPGSDAVHVALGGLAAAAAVTGLAGDEPWRRLGAVLPPLAALSLLAGARAPGAGYVTVWPLAGGAVAALTAGAHPAVRAAGATVAAAGAAATFVPLSRLLYQGLTPRMAAAAMLALQLGGELAAPALALLPPGARRAVAAGGLAGAAAVLAHRLTRPAAGTPETLSYLYDVDAGAGWYVSTDRHPTGWTSRFLGAEPARGPLPDFFPGWDREFLSAPAAPHPLPAPEVEVLADEPAAAGRRRVRLRVRTARGARQIGLTIPDAAVHAWSVEGRPGPEDPAGPWELWLYAPGDGGLEVSLLLDAAPARIRVIDRSDGLAAGPPASAFGSQTPAAALDVDGWGNGTFAARWLKI